MPSTLTLPDLTATESLAATIAAQTQPGDAILLQGPLGAGKTTFARAFLRAISNTPALDVPSPTFTLVQSYDTPKGPIHHYDLWRIGSPEALAELDWDEALDAIVLVEWPERLGPYRPANALTISFTLAANDARQVTLTGWEHRAGTEKDPRR